MVLESAVTVKATLLQLYFYPFCCRKKGFKVLNVICQSG